MKSLLLTVVLASACCLSALGQIGNVVYRVEPNQGPVSGGTEVVITGDFRLEPVISPPCIGAEVYIGGQRAEVISFTTEEVVVRTKAYTPGRFDVVVDRCGIRAELPNAFIVGEDMWERILLPTVLQGDVPGALGSLWRSEIIGFSRGSQTITSEPHLPCAIPEGCFTNTGRFLPTFSAAIAGPGRLLYTRGFQPEYISLTLRVRDVSREDVSLGTEIPVVREDDAYGPRSVFVIPDIPHGVNYRRKLRLYRIDTADPATLAIRVVRGDNSSVHDQLIELTGGSMAAHFLLQLPYAEIDLDAFTGANVIYISNPPDGLYWGFVSITNNATQQITTVTP